MSQTSIPQVVQPYLFFDGRCEEAIEFYRKVFDAKITGLMRFKDSPEGYPAPNASPEKVMHASIDLRGSTIMMSDGDCNGRMVFNGFGLSVTVNESAEVDRLFGLLAEGGQVTMPPMATFFSPRFAMVADKFGVMWMLIVAQAQAAPTP